MSAVKGRHVADSEPGTQNVPRNAPRSGNFTLWGLLQTREIQVSPLCLNPPKRRYPRRVYTNEIEISPVFALGMLPKFGSGLDQPRQSPFALMKPQKSGTTFLALGGAQVTRHRQLRQGSYGFRSPQQPA